jgi:hypothetical protein
VLEPVKGIAPPPHFIQLTRGHFQPQLLDVESGVEFFDRFLQVAGHAITVLPLKFVAGFTEYSPGFDELLVGFPLPLVVIKITFEIQPQLPARGFDLAHCLGAMACVIMVGLFQQMKGMDQFFTGRFGIGVKTERQGQHNRHDSKIIRMRCQFHGFHNPGIIMPIISDVKSCSCKFSR